MQRRKAAIHVFCRFSPVNLDERGVIWSTVPVGRGGWWGGPGTC